MNKNDECPVVFLFLFLFLFFVLWFICRDSFNSRNILEDKLWICCVWKVWSICTNNIYQKKRGVTVRPWAGLPLLGCIVNKESQPMPSRCYIWWKKEMFHKEPHEGQICLLKAICWGTSEMLCRLQVQNRSALLSSLVLLYMEPW